MTQTVQNILFITSTRIGDAILSTGLLDYMIRTYPEASITVACGPLVKGFFEPVPQVTTVHALKKQSYSRHWLELWKKTVGTRWDIVVDLRNSAVSRLIRTRKRYIFGGHIDKSKHKAEQNAQVMGLDHVPDLRLWFCEEDVAAAKAAIEREGKQANVPVLAVGPAANWIGKTWPGDRFITLIDRLTNPESETCILPNARVAILAAPGEEAQARPVLESVPEHRRIDLIAKGSPEFAAACLSQCDLYVGNDSGLMHSAAAANIPTFGLFGPSWPHIYSPWGAYTDHIATEKNFAELIDYEGYSPETAPCLMESLDTGDVTARVVTFWNGLQKNKTSA